jgi:hypothetical protein
VHVPLVRRRAVEGLRPQEAVASLLEYDRLTSVVESEPTELARDLRSENAGRLGLGLQLGPQRVVEPVAVLVTRLRRDNTAPDEVGDLLA